MFEQLARRDQRIDVSRQSRNAAGCGIGFEDALADGFTESRCRDLQGGLGFVGLLVSDRRVHLFHQAFHGTESGAVASLPLF